METQFVNQIFEFEKNDTARMIGYIAKVQRFLQEMIWCNKSKE
jgi:hypothetical protein